MAESPGEGRVQLILSVLEGILPNRKMNVGSRDLQNEEANDEKNRMDRDYSWTADGPRRADYQRKHGGERS